MFKRSFNDIMNCLNEQGNHLQINPTQRVAEATEKEVTPFIQSNEAIIQENIKLSSDTKQPEPQKTFNIWEEKISFDDTQKFVEDALKEAGI